MNPDPKMRIEFSTDYYPFGQPMPERNFNEVDYRFGFNGKENDNEIAGTGGWQNYGMREYDTRIARFISVDPLTKKYPFYSPYQFAGNCVIAATDLDGSEPDWVVDKNGKLTKPVISLIHQLTGLPEKGMEEIVITKNVKYPELNAAETWGKDDVRTNPDAYDNPNDPNWLTTVAAELKHRQDYEDSWLPAALIQIGDYWERTYREKVIGMNHTKAYRGTKMEKPSWDAKFKVKSFIDMYKPESVLTDNKLTDNEKTTVITGMVNEYFGNMSKNFDYFFNKTGELSTPTYYGGTLPEIEISSNSTDSCVD